MTYDTSTTNCKVMTLQLMVLIPAWADENPDQFVFTEATQLREIGKLVEEVNSSYKYWTSNLTFLIISVT
jgi:hypothetical protein